MNLHRSISPWYHLLYGRHEPSVNEVVAAVCAEYGVGCRAVMGKSKLLAHTEPRHMAMALLATLNGTLRQKEVAALFKVHHTTIIYANNNIRAMVQIYPAYRARYDRIASALLRGEFKHHSNTVQP